MYLGRCEIATTRHGKECDIGRTFSHKTFDRRVSNAVSVVHTGSWTIVS